MIAILRVPQYHMNRKSVALLVGLYFEAADFLAKPDEPIAQCVLTTTQDALIAETNPSTDRWSDPEAISVGQRLLDAHPVYGGRGLVLQMPPDLPPEPEPDAPAEPNAPDVPALPAPPSA